MEVSFISLLSCNQFAWWVEEEDPPLLPTPSPNGHPELVRWGGGGGGRPPSLPTPPPNGHPELVRSAMRRRRTPTPYPPHQMVLTVKSSRWVIICVFHARPPCTHYTAALAYCDAGGLASFIYCCTYKKKKKKKNGYRKTSFTCATTLLASNLRDSKANMSF